MKTGKRDRKRSWKDATIVVTTVVFAGQHVSGANEILVVNILIKGVA